ncbi:outer membrane lipoprotein-sorting protein [Carboxydochorda subterranea]|uniref:Outer membrane lipoprotein-sorting protein n=1 Tax=Carboxydichorda subterranea TaxID=3109565 RepID=A0ABZ1BV12_9FIRM|nr:outer membrane lipoprotein-sorting protein [Limnochorda sp. L945t]WRP16529.1 outer membrane lipoprotein-sorting protein [Limnochorda sp. L945t]
MKRSVGERVGHRLRGTLRVVWSGVLAAWVTVVMIAAGALAAELSASEILDRMTGTAVLSGSGQAELELVTENARGQQRANRLRIFRMEASSGATQQLLEYLDPPDVRGTKFLSIDEPDKPAQMWLYLPALGRERRIAGSATQDQFMGTDFTYDEIGGGTTYKEDYTAQRLADTAVDGRAAYVLKLTPKSTDKKYSYVQMWVWKETFLPLRIDFFDRSGRLEKQLLTADFRQDEQGKWLPYRITMVNAKSKSKTLVQLISQRSGAVPDEYFTLRYLRR